MIRKKIFFAISTLTFTTCSLANINANNGFYLGAGAVLASYSTPPGTAFSSSFFPITDGYFRPFIGYRFTDYVALEAGYNDIVNDQNQGDSFWGPDHYRLWSIDLAAKFIAPFENGFSLFGKIGAGYTHQNVFNQTFTGGTIVADSNDNRLQPLLGVGASYNFTSNFATDLSYTHLFKNGNIGDINMIGLGASYTFNNS